MAATPFAPSFHPSFSPFDIFHDGGAARNTPPPASPSLPGGPCNYVDLTHGPNGPRCGCRRFWSSKAAGPGNRTTDQTGWCMCSHHACYHDDAQNTQAIQAVQAVPAPVVEDVPGPEQENEKPRSNREPLSPVQDFASLHMPSGLGASMDFAAMNFSSFSSNMGLGAIPPQGHPPQSIPPGPAMDTDSLPDTLSWRNVISTQGGQSPLPPIPSPCLIPSSQSASTTASSQLRYLRPFGGKGLNTLSGVPFAQGPAIDGSTNTNKGVNTVPGIPSECHNHEDAANVPSGATTPTPGAPQLLGTPRPASALSATGQSNANLQSVNDAVQDHEQRIETLESGSIYNTALEEFSQKHDMTDLRVTELETRMDDVEKKLINDNASVVSSRRIAQRDDDATVSEVSVSTNATVRAADRAGLARLLEPLQARVNRLESFSVPSYTSPWEVEVVFLPFALKGVWVEAQDFKARALSTGRDDFTPLPHTNSRATPEPQALAAYDEWVGQASGWLLPRACAPGRMIDKRLRSRGFSKTVQIRGGDARSVQLAIGNAFESVLHMMPHPASPRLSYAADPRRDKFIGLQQPWVPLRKVHKDPRLRFLSPAELLTPALWNATFLMDSIVMKATGMHRLYVTQPEAYLQDNDAVRAHNMNYGWAWQKLRELDRVYPDSQASNCSSEVPEADALEVYWAYNARLDEPLNARQSSVGPHQSHEKDVSMSRATDASTEQYFTVPSIPNTSMGSPAMIRGQSPFTQYERRGSRPPYIRTGSVPPVHSPSIASPARSSRHMSAFAPIHPVSGSGYQRHSSPLVTGRPSPRPSVVSNAPATAMVTKKRRRSTRSPSARPYNTPRYSNRSYSRSPSVTPFPVHPVYIAYMTPHSNAPPLFSQPPQVSNGRSVHFGGNHEIEDDVMDFEDDRGSLTGSSNEGSDGVMAEEDDDDANNSVYEDRPDALDDLGSDFEGRHNPMTAQQQLFILAQQRSSHPQGPEDIPRQGVEDNMSHVHGLVPFGTDDEDEEAGDSDDTESNPSEYTSKQVIAPWASFGEEREMTHAIEDDDNDDDDDGVVGVVCGGPAPGPTTFVIHEDGGEEKLESQVSYMRKRTRRAEH